MPAKRKREDHLIVTAEPVEEPNPVFFTDQNPEFEVTVTNNHDHAIGNGTMVKWALGIGEGKPDPSYKGSLDIDLEPGETETYNVEVDMLAYDRHGVFGVAYGGAYGSDDVKKLHDRRFEAYVPLYSFSVWDRSQYNAIHEQPKKNQKWIILSSILVAILASIQVYTIFF